MNPLVKRTDMGKIEAHQWLDKMITAAAEYDGPPHDISRNAKLKIIWLDASGKPTGPDQGKLNPAEKAFSRRNNQMIKAWRDADEIGAFWTCTIHQGPTKKSKVRIDIVWDDCYFLIDTAPSMRADIIEYSKTSEALLTIPELSVVI